MAGWLDRWLVQWSFDIFCGFAYGLYGKTEVLQRPNWSSISELEPQHRPP